MKKENITDLLKQAKEMFTPGTKYYGYLSGRLQFDKIETVDIYDCFDLYDSNSNIGIESHSSYLYSRGKWGQIINESNIYELW